MNAVFSPARKAVCCQCTSVMRGISHQAKKQQRSLCPCERSEPKAVHKLIFFSERELTFMFAICYRLCVVCHLSVVCNVCAHYSGGSNFRQYFYGIMYLGLGWWRSPAVEHRSLAGVLSLSCARLVADG